MAGYLLADSFGQLGQENIAEDSNRRLAMANAMSAAMSGLQSGMRQHLAQRAQDLAEAQAEFESGPEGHPELGYKNRELKLRQDQLAQSTQAEKDRNAIADEWVKIGKQQIEIQKQNNPTAAREADLEYNRAFVNASQFGGYDNADEVLATHPKLTPQQATAIALVSSNARRQKDAEYDLASGSADVLNKRDALKKQLADLGITNPSTATAPTSHMWTSDAGRSKNQQIAQALTDWKTVSPKAARIEAPNSKLGILTRYDPDTDSYVPTVPTPPWRTPGGAAKAAPAPPAANSVPTTMRTGPATNAAVATALTNTGTTPAAAPATQPKYDPWVYQRVNQLIQGGVDALNAKKQALAEWSQASAAGNQP
jgi:hypothetical protein